MHGGQFEIYFLLFYTFFLSYWLICFQSLFLMLLAQAESSLTLSTRAKQCRGCLQRLATDPNNSGAKTSSSFTRVTHYIGITRLTCFQLLKQNDDRRNLRSNGRKNGRSVDEAWCSLETSSNVVGCVPSALVSLATVNIRSCKIKQNVSIL